METEGGKIGGDRSQQEPMKTKMVYLLFKGQSHAHTTQYRPNQWTTVYIYRAAHSLKDICFPKVLYRTSHLLHHQHNY